MCIKGRLDKENVTHTHTHMHTLWNSTQSQKKKRMKLYILQQMDTTGNYYA